MAPIALATMMEHIGDMSAISAHGQEKISLRIRDCTGRWSAMVSQHRWLQLVGGPANTTYGENTGVLGIKPCP